MFNQINQREKNAIETLLNLNEDSQKEIDYDREMQRFLFKPQQNTVTSIVQKPRSQILKLICPKSNSNLQSFDYRGRSLEKQSERIVVPNQYKPKYLLQQLKTQRYLRHVSEHQTINVFSIQNNLLHIIKQQYQQFKLCNLSKQQVSQKEKVQLNKRYIERRMFNYQDLY